MIRRKDEALPGFWCSVHENRLRSPARPTSRALLPGGTPDLLDRLARRGSVRLEAWAEGRDESFPVSPRSGAIPDHTASPHGAASLDEPPVLSQSAQGDNQGIQRQLPARRCSSSCRNTIASRRCSISRPAPALTELARSSILRNLCPGDCHRSPDGCPRRARRSGHCGQ